ncbi:DUF3800 domain-containing protein [Conchiformibius steedae]|uniref:DUF3800 domain-containing protein n=1 Tax=Conchiformibius steedae TaxID=153493 RepID=A0A3P2A7F8_9NEIS|nr:DUF3800 domain-containing protein [Conchiformibius steedae]RRD90826.1 hypothetical protein EII21_04260 [Conchiformibius steedae]
MLFLEPSNLKLNFYFDETNNIRKFYLSSKKMNYVNSMDTPFILGGVAMRPSLLNDIKFELSIEELFKKWGVQTSQKEVKFKHIANGDFPTILTSKKLDNLFDFLNEQEIFIHMYVLDVIHWSLIDIIESKCAFNVCKEFLWIDERIFYEVKALLTEIARTFMRDFFKELFELGYPDISNKQDDFISFLKKYLCKYARSQEYKNSPIHPLLLKILWIIFIEFEKNDDENDAFCLLKGELAYNLIKEFNDFYLYRIEQFPNSHLLFDEEKQVMDRLKDFPSKHLNYKFIKSNGNKLIQMSDILIGFVRCLFNYLSGINYANVEENYQNLDEIQKKCLQKFFLIYEKSVSKDEKMVVFTCSIFDLFKFNLLRDLCKKDSKS